MQKMIEGKGIAPHFQMEFGSLVEQLLLCMTQNIEEYVKNAIGEIVNNFKPPQASKEGLEIEDGFLTRAETLKFLQISSPTLFRYQKTGLLPYHKIGRKIFFKKTDLVESTKCSLTSRTR